MYNPDKLGANPDEMHKEILHAPQFKPMKSNDALALLGIAREKSTGGPFVPTRRSIKFRRPPF